jgi:hypothetical protein
VRCQRCYALLLTVRLHNFWCHVDQGNILMSREPGPVNQFGANLTTLITGSLLKRKQHAVFLDSCSHHCGLWDQIRIDGDVVCFPKLTVACPCSCLHTNRTPCNWTYRCTSHFGAGGTTQSRAGQQSSCGSRAKRFLAPLAASRHRCRARSCGFLAARRCLYSYSMHPTLHAYLYARSRHSNASIVMVPVALCCGYCGILVSRDIVWHSD